MEEIEGIENFCKTKIERAKFAYEECVKRHDYTLNIKKQMEEKAFKVICTVLPVMFLICGWSINIFTNAVNHRTLFLCTTLLYLIVQGFALYFFMQVLRSRPYSLIGWAPSRLWHKSFLNLRDIAFYHRLSEKYNVSININNNSNKHKVKAFNKGVECFIYGNVTYIVLVDLFSVFI